MNSKEHQQSDAEKEYQRFDRVRHRIIMTLIYILILLIVFLIIGFKVVDSTPIPLLISASILVIFSFLSCIISRKIASLHDTLYFEAYGNSTDIIKSGIFKELWDEYDDRQFVGLFDFKTKINFMETHNNAIDIIVTRNHHEIAIEINEVNIDFIVDEESDLAIYHSIPLTDIKSIEDVYILIPEFIRNHT